MLCTKSHTSVAWIEIVTTRIAAWIGSRAAKANIGISTVVEASYVESWPEAIIAWCESLTAANRTETALWPIETIR